MMMKITKEMLELHRKWRDGEGGKRLVLIGANLNGANLSGAYLSGADLREADLRGAYLENITVNWQSHDLIAEILKRAAGDNMKKRQLAGLILISRELCWNDFLAMKLLHTKWALNELRKWVKDGDGAPDVLTA